MKCTTRWCGASQDQRDNGASDDRDRESWLMLSGQDLRAGTMPSDVWVVMCSKGTSEIEMMVRLV